MSASSPESPISNSLPWVLAGHSRETCEPDRPTLAELARRIDTGAVRPVVGEVFPLERGQQAFEAKRRGGVPGKVVLRVAR